MKHNPLMQEGIRAALNAMHEMLEQASSHTGEAAKHADSNRQNLAIGTIILVEELLEQASALYNAILSIHRFHPAEGTCQ